MAIVESQLYVGTTWGCVIVAEGSTMCPITVFRPFEEEVKAILPLPQKKQLAAVTTSSSESQSPIPTWHEPPRIATVGKGYRNLISRYLPVGASLDSLHQNMYVILWRTDAWTDS